MPTSATTPTPTQPPTGVFRSLTSPGGGILARCTGATVYVVSASPNQGYRVQINRREGDEAEVKFTGDFTIAAHLRCESGEPVQELETESGSGAG